MELFKLEEAFKKNVFKNEDDIKLHFHSESVVKRVKSYSGMTIQKRRYSSGWWKNRCYISKYFI